MGRLGVELIKRISRLLLLLNCCSLKLLLLLLRLCRRKHIEWVRSLLRGHTTLAHLLRRLASWHRLLLLGIKATKLVELRLLLLGLLLNCGRCASENIVQIQILLRAHRLSLPRLLRLLRAAQYVE